MSKKFFEEDEIAREAEKLVHLLTQKRLRVSAAESCTGGMLAAAITSVSGASAVLEGSVVCYSAEVKESLLGVPKDVIAHDGVVSVACARSMASGVRKLMNADLAVGITGWAGPYGGDGQEAGTVCIGIAAADLQTAICTHFDGTRNEVRRAAVLEALRMLIAATEERSGYTV